MYVKPEREESEPWGYLGEECTGKRKQLEERPKVGAAREVGEKSEEASAAGTERMRRLCRVL